MHNRRRKSERKQFLLQDIKKSNMMAKIKDNKSPLIFDEFTFKIITSILIKSTRNSNDLLILQYYLKSISQFLSLIENSPDCKNIDEILYQMAVLLRYEKKHTNSILFRQGDKGNKFYILLKGSASVFILKEEKCFMSFKNYIKHLIYLKMIKEDEICTKTIQFNILNYYIEEKEIDEFINELRSNNKQDHFERKTIKIYSDEIKDFELFYKENKAISSHNNRFTVRELIDISKPLKQLIDASALSQEISTFIYYQITTKQRGDSIDEIALFQGHTKRTATILCDEVCTFGTLTREDYNSTIRDIQNKIRKNNVNFLLRYKLFSELNYDIFDSKFLNFFIEKKLTQGQYLATQGSERNEIHFIREGDFELVTKCNIKELAEITRIKKKIPIKRYIGSQVLIDDITERTKLHQQNYRIAIIRQNDVIGLPDLLYDNKYICTVVCISPQALIYSIEPHILEEIMRKIPKVERDLNGMLYPREEFISTRLTQLLEYANDHQRKIELKNVKKMRLLKLFNSEDDKKINMTINTPKFKSKLLSNFQLDQPNKTALTFKIRNKLKYNTNTSTIGKSSHRNPTYNSREVNWTNGDNDNVDSIFANQITSSYRGHTKRRIQTAKEYKLITPELSLRIREKSAHKSQMNKQKILKGIMGSLYKERVETNESKRLSSAITMNHDDYTTNRTIDSTGHGVIDSMRLCPKRKVIVDFLLYDNYINPNKQQTFITSNIHNKIKYYFPIKNIPVNYFNKARPLRITCLKKNIS